MEIWSNMACRECNGDFDGWLCRDCHAAYRAWRVKYPEKAAVLDAAYAEDKEGSGEAPGSDQGFGV